MHSFPFWFFTHNIAFCAGLAFGSWYYHRTFTRKLNQLSTKLKIERAASSLNVASGAMELVQTSYRNMLAPYCVAREHHQSPTGICSICGKPQVPTVLKDSNETAS